VGFDIGATQIYSSMQTADTVPDAPEMPMISRRGELFVILPPSIDRA